MKAMWENYLKIAWRNLLKNKVYSLINIGGLSIGMSCFMVIFLYVHHEFSYDQFYENEEGIYRAYQRQKGNVHLGSDYFAVMPAGLSSVLVDEIPEVHQATAIKATSALIGSEKEMFFESGALADPQFFRVFNYPLLLGNPQTALDKKGTIVLSETLAKKIFGGQNPVGQEILFQEEPFTVTGIMKAFPNNSSFKFSFVASIQSNGEYIRDIGEAKWKNNGFHVFFTSDGQEVMETVEAKLQKIYEKHIGYDSSYPFEDTYLIQPLSEVHLETNVNFDIGEKGNVILIFIFSLVGIIVLLLACVNYMNLAIARSIKRTKEVGVRKVMGADKGQLISQFISESMLTSLLSLLGAIFLIYYFLPFFGQMMEKPLELVIWENSWLLFVLLILVIFVGILSGSYPAFVISKLRPIEALKGRIKGGLSPVKLQNLLIIVQYAVSIGLIVCSLVIFRQYKFIQDKDLGYNKENVINIPVRDESIKDHFSTLKSRWLTEAKIQSATFSQYLPTDILSSTVITEEGSQTRADELMVYVSQVGYDYLEVFGIKLLAGRDFTPDINSENLTIVNEATVRALGWSVKEAVGKIFSHDGREERIIGVVKDFHMHSMHMPIQPLMLQLNEDFYNYISVKVSPEELGKTLSFIEESISEVTDNPFEYQFLDIRYNSLYSSDQKLGEMIGLGTLISVLIASMGLYGLVAFSSELRTKEISIRKILGASLYSNLLTLSKGFLKMVLLGFALSVPISWLIMNWWLQGYAYRTNLDWWLFALAGIGAVLIALLTVSSQAIKTALMNPVNSLKDE